MYPADYIEAVNHTSGQLDIRSSLLKCLVSLLAVASGNAIGREGAMILLAAVFASLLTCKNASEDTRKLWLACGVAAGVSGAYHAPVAGSLFAIEVLKYKASFKYFVLIIVSSTTTWLLNLLVFAQQGILYHVAKTPSLAWEDYLLICSLAIFMGMIGASFIGLMRCSTVLFKRFPASTPVKFALAGAVVGIASIPFPQVWGNGYSVIQSFLLTPIPFYALCLLLLLKLLAVLLCSSAGIPGGVLTPSLFVGAAVGLMLYAGMAGHLDGHTMLVLAAMASLLAAVTHAPVMSAIMICEMTHQYQLLPLLLLSCLLSYQVARRIIPNSIYTKSSPTYP